MAISLKRPAEIENMRAANMIVARTLDYISTIIKPGISLLEIDKICEDMIRSAGAKPAFKGLYGFPNAACISVNEVVIHGIPNEYVLKKGDIVSVDIGSNLNGYFGDSARTFGVGEISKQDKALIDCSKDSLYFAIDFIEAGMHFKEVCYEIEKFILARGFVPLRGFCGHGIGKRPHEEPEVPNYLEGNNPKAGPKIKNGMTFCIEPMICQKDGTPIIGADKWKVTSKDGLRTSHYEHCVAIVNGKAEILSKSEI
ncbi:type I methionyl aminopeptidase [Campylobacter sp. RM9344]|uniref:Methionine aminopeptidase n=1 Tax=Campylobacter californiensis TaxID=1032243 RepID=A0AAW3ZW31_9BACT|nr:MULTISPECIES: type I methionyl aminopeptidase [unclassified Campylobacter]MBE2985200.1 type I methionyl aminopeptidase [Campylobacter sp. RM6883]MBE2986974.1 type I methionyl aminopeptidase [Campylobacter sp. RM12919]MBE2988619.1 type I methionyl aminopeptidase [Campylobacter sp. RM12920]MBE2995277.1 type I methionyl aminopeptidase [Campylobacter sp. RM6913]MBE3022038.1 type I methionyl aminopeptidase [Campylobacter sp. 7477a]MBE3029919.1 type I methionyl aminopeptidase [Campylobacter sp. 